MKRWGFVGVGIILAWGLAAASSRAEEAQKPPEGSDQVDDLLVRYNMHPAFEKLGRGLGNATTGWMELPLNIQKHYVPNDAATTVFSGTVIGLVKGVARTAVGVYETATFFLPYPENFAPILPTIEYMKRAEKQHEPLLLE